MRSPLIALAAVLGATLITGMAGAQTEEASCKARAADKRLAGAALTSFSKKCETDARSTCDARAAEKRLAGAAKASFTKKCVSDAVGS